QRPHLGSVRRRWCGVFVVVRFPLHARTRRRQSVYHAPQCRWVGYLIATDRHGGPVAVAAVEAFGVDALLFYRGESRRGVYDAGPDDDCDELSDHAVHELFNAVAAIHGAGDA